MLYTHWINIYHSYPQSGRDTNQYGLSTARHGALHATGSYCTRLSAFSLSGVYRTPMGTTRRDASSRDEGMTFQLDTRAPGEALACRSVWSTARVAGYEPHPDTIIVLYGGPLLLQLFELHDLRASSCEICVLFFLLSTSYFCLINRRTSSSRLLGDSRLYFFGRWEGSVGWEFVYTESVDKYPFRAEFRVDVVLSGVYICVLTCSLHPSPFHNYHYRTSCPLRPPCDNETRVLAF